MLLLIQAAELVGDTPGYQVGLLEHPLHVGEGRSQVAALDPAGDRRHRAQVLTGNLRLTHDGRDRRHTF